MTISTTILSHPSMIEKSILPTGLQVITKLPSGFNKSELIWSIPLGSRHSNLSHFLYHSLLVGSTTRLSNLAITRLSELSGSPLSASLHRDNLFLKFISPNLSAREDHVQICADILQNLKIEDWQIDSIIRDRIRWDVEGLKSDPQAFLTDMIHQISFRERGLGNSIFSLPEDKVTGHELSELLNKKIKTNPMFIFANHYNHEEFKAIIGKYWNTNIVVADSNVNSSVDGILSSSSSSLSLNQDSSVMRIGHRAEWRQYKSNLDRNYCILGFPKAGKPSPTLDHLLAYYLIDCTLRRLALVSREFNYEIRGQIHLYNDASLYTILFSQPNYHNDDSGNMGNGNIISRDKKLMEHFIKKSLDTVKKIIRENASVVRAKMALEFDQKDQSLSELALQWNIFGKMDSNDFDRIENSSIIKLALEILELNIINYACMGDTRELPYLDDIVSMQ